MVIAATVLLLLIVAFVLAELVPARLTKTTGRTLWQA
jgi:hypothetical protein